MTATVLYKGARLLDPVQHLDEIGDLLIADGKIAGINVDTPSDAEIVECDGLTLLPGLIDSHVFIGEPGGEHRETYKSAGRAAAHGGVTSMITMPDTNPIIDDPALVESVISRAEERTQIRAHPLGSVTKSMGGSAIAEMGLMKRAGAVGFLDNGHWIANATVMRRALVYAADIGTVLMSHVREPSLAPDGVMNEGELASRYGLEGIPPAAELIALERDIRLVELTGAPCHIEAISCAASLDIIENAKAHGLPVTCGVSAAHLSLNETDISEYRTFFKISPPLRREEDRAALVDGLTRGVIDIVHSGHEPHDQEAKRHPFADAAFGAAGIETLLAVVLEQVHNGSLDLITAVKAMTTSPARLFGLESGTLLPGQDADFTLVDLGKPFVIEADKLNSKSKNSPFDGRRLQGLVTKTIVGGDVVFEAS